MWQARHSDAWITESEPVGFFLPNFIAVHLAVGLQGENITDQDVAELVLELDSDNDTDDVTGTNFA